MTSIGDRVSARQLFRAGWYAVVGVTVWMAFWVASRQVHLTIHAGRIGITSGVGLNHIEPYLLLAAGLGAAGAFDLPALGAIALCGATALWGVTGHTASVAVVLVPLVLARVALCRPARTAAACAAIAVAAWATLILVPKGPAPAPSEWVGLLLACSLPLGWPLVIAKWRRPRLNLSAPPNP